MALPIAQALPLDLLRQHISQVLSGRKWKAHLTAVPDWPVGRALSIDKDAITKFSDLSSLPDVSEVGFVEWLWFVTKAAEDELDVTNDGEFMAWWTALGIEVSTDIETPANDVLTKLAYLDLFISSGSNWDNKKEKAMIKGASTGKDIKSGKDLWGAASPWDNNGWLSVTAQDLLFHDREAVQGFFNLMGASIKDWAMSHSAAGTAAMARLVGFAKTFAVSAPVFLSVYVLLSKHNMVPEYAIAYLEGSFQKNEMEGFVLMSMLWKMAVASPAWQGRPRDVYRSLVDGFFKGLGSVEQAKMDATSSGFGRTIRSKAAREKLNQKLTVACEDIRTNEHVEQGIETLINMPANLLYYGGPIETVVTEAAYAAVGNGLAGLGGLDPPAPWSDTVTAQGHLQALSALAGAVLRSPASVASIRQPSPAMRNATAGTVSKAAKAFGYLEYATKFKLALEESRGPEPVEALFDSDRSTGATLAGYAMPAAGLSVAAQVAYSAYNKFFQA